MKKSSLFILLALLGTLSTYAQVRLGIKAGFSSANVKSDTKDMQQRLAGWHAGVIADIELLPCLSLQPQLLYSAKGFRTKEVTLAGPNGTATMPSTTTKLNYLELPVNLLYKHQLGSGKIFGGAGPYIACGIGGKAGDTKIKFDGKKTPEANDENYHAKRIDAGANILLGYELKNGLLFSANYSIGMTDISTDGKSKNNYFGISVGFLLPSKK